MFHTRVSTFSIAMLFATVCHAQQLTLGEQPVSSDSSDAGVGLIDRIRVLEDRNDRVKDIADFLVLTFILVMFTNAVICGHWAISTNRNFWGWYLFGLFTGPLAGGFMLDRSARERSGGNIPGGAWGAVAGIGIPLAGWIIWMILLK